MLRHCFDSELWKARRGMLFHADLQTGQMRPPLVRTCDAMQGKWKACAHSAVYTAIPCPVLMLCKHTPQLVLWRRKLFFNIENGDLGEAGVDFEPGLGDVVLQRSFGLLLLPSQVWLLVLVLQRRLGLLSKSPCKRGVDGALLPPPLDKNPSLPNFLGLGFVRSTSRMAS